MTFDMQSKEIIHESFLKLKIKGFINQPKKHEFENFSHVYINICIIQCDSYFVKNSLTLEAKLDSWKEIFYWLSGDYWYKWYQFKYKKIPLIS